MHSPSSRQQHIRCRQHSRGRRSRCGRSSSHLSPISSLFSSLPLNTTLSPSLALRRPLDLTPRTTHIPDSSTLVMRPISGGPSSTYPTIMSWSQHMVIFSRAAGGHYKIRPLLKSECVDLPAAISRLSRDGLNQRPSRTFAAHTHKTHEQAEEIHTQKWGEKRAAPWVGIHGLRSQRSRPRIWCPNTTAIHWAPAPPSGGIHKPQGRPFATDPGGGFT
jgi:hypothetical protein